MAKNKENSINKNLVVSLMKNIQGNIQNIYRNTHITSTTNMNDMNSIKASIDKSMDNISMRNVDAVGSTSISSLYARIQDKNGGSIADTKFTNEVQSIFEDKMLTDTLAMAFADNKDLKEYDEEIDTICKYMSSLDDALEAKKDNVLSADHFSKDFLNARNASNMDNINLFSSRIKEMKKKYNLLEFLEDTYDNTSRYGEDFIYMVDYNKALKKLLATKNSSILRSNLYSTNESAKINDQGIITETFSFKNMYDENNTSESGKTDIPTGEFKCTMNVTGILTESVEQHQNLKNIIEKTNNIHKKFDNIFTDKQEYDLEGPNNSTSLDGTIDMNRNNKDKVDINVPGCIIKRIPRENIIVVYIDQVCLGYYYLEFDMKNMIKNVSSSDPLVGFKTALNRVEANNDTKEQSLKFIASKLSSFIDRQFINNNQDLREEIYMILKYNDISINSMNEVKITFIPPEDMVHVYFEKDPKTNRGISDLHKSLVPAKFFVSLYVTTWLGIITRGYDKRVYYVKQNVDTNIAKVLLNTVNQIKKSNFGAREISSIKTLLNIGGRYQDMIVPMNATGESPMNFEIMQGQNIEIKTELLDMLEQMAINSTDVPYDYVQSRKNVDYAVRLTMSSGKFLRKVFKRQSKTQVFFSRIFTKLYNTEYDENDIIEIELPPPSFLNLINTQQVIASTKEQVMEIVEMEASQEEQDVQDMFKNKLMKHYLGGHLDLKAIDDIKKQAKMEITKERDLKKAEQEASNN